MLTNLLKYKSRKAAFAFGGLEKEIRKIKSQHPGGVLLPPVQKLVATMIKRISSSPKAALRRLLLLVDLRKRFERLNRNKVRFAKDCLHRVYIALTINLCYLIDTTPRFAFYVQDILLAMKYD